MVTHFAQEKVQLFLPGISPSLHAGDMGGEIKGVARPAET